MFPLEIFPETGLAESVITTVWVGVFVVSIFNLRLGWPFSGLVVPGYLVPLMLAKPIAAGVVCVEAFLTYAIVKFSCDRFVNSSYWSSFFGRDRFFALIVVSLIVRLVLDGWVLPTVGHFINEGLGIHFDYRNHLSSFGLIIVALIANQFWKTGWVGGMVPFATTVGITYVIVRYGLVEFTNFNIGNLEYMYENISSSLVASPKAYIILLTCAFAASRMNLLYGWDYNGILIPSLLALEWYHPETILNTFVEAFIILGLGSVCMRLPVLNRMTIEGARKMLLFFNVSYAYKWLIGWVQYFVQPSVELTDFYGYGYLVPTLIAIKIHDKRIPLRLTRATLQTSFTGAILASVVGFGLTLIPSFTGSVGVGPSELILDDDGESLTLMEALRRDKVNLYEKRGGGEFVVPLAHEQDHFVRALRSIDRYTRTGEHESFDLARRELARIGYRMDVLENRYLYLREAGESRGWGIYVFDQIRSEGPVVEVPAPLDEWAVLESGAFLFEMFGARGLGVSGCPRRLNRDGSSDVLRSGRTLYSVFHRMAGRGGVLQVRGYDSETIEELTMSLGEPLPADDSSPRSILWVTRSIPDGIDLSRLRDTIDSYVVGWGRTPYANLQRDDARGSFCELILSRQDRKVLLAQSVIRNAPGGTSTRVERLSGRVQNWLYDLTKDIAPKASNLYRTARPEELLFFDEDVLRPLLSVVREREPLGADAETELEVIHASASVFGYRLVRFVDEPTSREYIVLTDVGGIDRPYWGTYVFGLGERRPYCIQVPRPGAERSSAEFGVTLFDRLEARALYVAGCHPRANENGEAELASSANIVNLFNLANQVFARETDGKEAMVVQCRAFAFPEGSEAPTEDVLYGLADGCTTAACFSPLARELSDWLLADDVSMRIVNGDPQTSGFEAYGAPQSHYVLKYEEMSFGVLWLSPLFRGAFREQFEGSAESFEFEAAGISTLYSDLYDSIVASAARVEPWPEDLVADIDRYAESGNITILFEIGRRADVSRVVRVIDEESRTSFLVCVRPGLFPLVARMGGYARAGAHIVPVGELGRDAIERFKRTRLRRLEIVDNP